MLLNKGSVYDIIIGKFIVFIDGVYFFSWIIMLEIEKYFIMEIVFNSSLVVYNFIDGRGCIKNVGNVMLFLNVIIEMRKGDKVWIRVYDKYG